MPCLRIQMSLAQQPEDCHRATIELALLLPLYCTQYASLLLDSSSSSSSGCSGLHSITSLCPALTHSCCWPQEYMLLYQQLGDNFPQIKLLPSQSQVPTHAKPQSSRVVSSRLSYSRRSQSSSSSRTYYRVKAQAAGLYLKHSVVTLIQKPNCDTISSHSV